jgi:peroxiredoxin
MKSLMLAALIGLPFSLAANMAYALGVGEKAPCVELNNLAPDGSESDHCIRQPNAEGQFKILEFFSATCSDCAQNLPIISAVAAKTETVATTRLIGLDRDEKLTREYTKAHSDLIHFEVALDTNRDATKAYSVVATPTVFVLDPKNTVVFRKDDVLNDADVVQILKLVGAQ